MRSAAVAAIVAAVLIATAGCNRAEPIPVGAHVVHIAIVGSEIHLEPAAIPAGDVYLVLDTPLKGSITFVERKTSEDAVPGPLSADDLARLARGDTEFTAISGWIPAAAARIRTWRTAERWALAGTS